MMTENTPIESPDQENGNIQTPQPSKSDDTDSHYPVPSNEEIDPVELFFLEPAEPCYAPAFLNHPLHFDDILLYT